MEVGKQPRKRVSWLGRITVGVTVLVGAVWLFVLVSHLLPHEKPPQEMENIPWNEYLRGPVLLSASVVALLWALWRPLGGGIALIVDNEDLLNGGLIECRDQCGNHLSGVYAFFGQGQCRVVPHELVSVAEGAIDGRSVNARIGHHVDERYGHQEIIPSKGEFECLV